MPYSQQRWTCSICRDLHFFYLTLSAVYPCRWWQQICLSIPGNWKTLLYEIQCVLSVEKILFSMLGRYICRALLGRTIWTLLNPARSVTAQFTPMVQQLTQMKKALRETQTLRAGCSKAEPKIFAPPQTYFPGARDGQKLIGWRWSYLYLQTQFGQDRCMQFRVIVVTDPHTHPQTHTPTHPQTNRQDRLQYTAPQLARSVMTNRHQTFHTNLFISVRTMMAMFRIYNAGTVRHSEINQRRRWLIHRAGACRSTQAQTWTQKRMSDATQY